jgi:HK97 family phage portal protein
MARDRAADLPVILATRYGGDLQVRNGSTLSDLGVPLTTPSGAVTHAAGLLVGAQTVGGIPAVSSAVRHAAEGVAVLELGVYRGEGVQRVKVTNVWQSRLFAGQPNDQQDAFQFKETIEESLSYRGNAYVWKNVDPASGRVVEWFALHPDQVLPFYGYQGVRTYYVGVGAGFVDPVGKGGGFYRVGSETILHIKGFGDGGAWIAPSPIMRHRLALGASLAKLTHEAALYENGAAIKLAVVYPEGVSAERAETWRKLWDSTYGGSKQSGKTAVLGGGATIQPIGLSMTDAQFIESQGFSVDEIARIFNVPQSLIGGGRGTKGDHPLTPEHEQTRWLQFGLGPRLARIESAMRADPALFPPGSSVYPWFDTTGVVRGDLLTQAQISLTKVQSGQWVPDEARALDGLPPLPNGVGKIPQITPVGGGPNPGLKPASPTNPSGEETSGSENAKHLPALRNGGEQRVLSMPSIEIHVPEQAAPIVYVQAPEQAAPVIEVNVPAPVVNVAAPPPVEVNVPAPIVNVEAGPAPVVNVAVPEQPAAVVNVAPAKVELTVQTPKRRVTFERDTLGRIVEAETEDG